MRHFLEVDDLTPEELRLVLELSTKTALPAILDGKGVALIFEKPSGRTSTKYGEIKPSGWSGEEYYRAFPGEVWMDRI